MRFTWFLNYTSSSPLRSWLNEHAKSPKKIGPSLPSHLHWKIIQSHSSNLLRSGVSSYATKLDRKRNVWTSPRLPRIEFTNKCKKGSPLFHLVRVRLLKQRNNQTSDAWFDLMWQKACFARRKPRCQTAARFRSTKTKGSKLARRHRWCLGKYEGADSSTKQSKIKSRAWSPDL